MSKQRDESSPSSWRERRNLHPEDQRLRRAGFKIFARPRSCVAVWQRDGVLYAHDEALELLRVESEAKGNE